MTDTLGGRGKGPSKVGMTTINMCWLASDRCVPVASIPTHLSDLRLSERKNLLPVESVQYAAGGGWGPGKSEGGEVRENISHH